jgi:hypothetical protein
VSDPLGSASEVAELVLARYAFAAMELLSFDEEGNFTADADVDAENEIEGYAATA